MIDFPHFAKLYISIDFISFTVKNMIILHYENITEYREIPV